MVARKYPHGLSLEPRGLWLGRLAGRAAEHGAVRRLRTDSSHHIVRRLAGAALRTQFADAFRLSRRTGAGVRRAMDRRRRPPGGDADGLPSRRPFAHRAAQRSASREVSAASAGGALARADGIESGAWPRHADAYHLARVGAALSACARPASARRHRDTHRPRQGADDRLDAWRKKPGWRAGLSQ